tara:strand:+ start:353 stop:565 length:213 start_codon:yes stop_codon:yes gene_type:complete
MSNEEEEKSIKEVIANTILNQLNLNGVMEACKFYSINVANNQYTELSDEDKQTILDNIKNNQQKETAPAS